MQREFDDKLLSVIIPVYNADKYLAACINSVLEQTYTGRKELVLVDDMSEDNSLSIIKEYAAKYDFIHHLSTERNSGPGIARNLGLEYAKGRFVAFIDADDIWKRDKLKKQFELIEKKDGVIYYTAIESIDSEGSLKKTKRNIKELADYKTLLKNTLIANSSVIVDRQKAGDFRSSTRLMSQDYSTWLSLLRTGAKAYGINEALVQYRVHEDSLSYSKLRSLKYIWDVQREDEGINPIYVLYNLLHWSCHAVGKHFL